MLKFHEKYTHNDLNLGNIIYDEDDAKIYIIDFEYLNTTPLINSINITDTTKSDRDHMNNALTTLILLGDQIPEISKFMRDNDLYTDILDFALNIFV